MLSSQPGVESVVVAGGVIPTEVQRIKIVVVSYV